MTRRAKVRVKLARAREEVKKRGTRIAELKMAHGRLERLYEISKVLTRFRDVTRTVPEVLALVARTLPVRSVVFVVVIEGPPRVISWVAEGEKEGRLQAATATALATFAYLRRSSAAFGSRADGALKPPGQDEPMSAGRTEAAVRQIILPLVVGRGPVFGVLLFECDGPLDEGGLSFANSVVNQLAIAVDRQAEAVARQAAADAAAQDQRLLAQVGVLVAASLDSAATLAAVAHCAVPAFADLCMVDEVEAGVASRVAVVFADERKHRELAEGLKRYAPQRGWTTPQARVLESGSPLLVERVQDPVVEGMAQDEEHASLLRAAAITSEMVVPLMARGRRLGVLTFAVAESGRRYTARDLALAEEIARRAAIGVDNSRLFEHAQRAAQARDDLLAIVSHDLKNPMNIILLNLGILLRLPTADERRKSRKQLVSIRSAVDRMNRLSEDLLDTASIDGGHLTIEADRLDARALIAEVLETMSLLAAAKSVTLGSELPPNLPAVSADRHRLTQAFANVLGNAIKFTPPGGTVTLRATAEGCTVTFSVADTGPGIAEADLPHLFDRLWQARGTARLGTGLGLFIVKGIVEAHGGRVWATSRLGAGATFFFTLPVAPVDVQAKVGEPGSSPSQTTSGSSSRTRGPHRAPGSPRQQSLARAGPTSSPRS